MNPLDSLSAFLNTSILSGAPGLTGITAGRTLTALVCLVCAFGIGAQAKRAWPHIKLMVKAQTVVPLPALRLVQALAGFILLLLAWVLLYAGQAASTYYSARYQTLGERDVVVTLTVFNLAIYAVTIFTAVLLSWLSVMVADVVTGEQQERRQLGLRRRASGGRSL